MKPLLLKVCGMKESPNMKEVIEEVSPDFMGFIFYDKSPRYLDGSIDDTVACKRVGVFVNSPVEKILTLSKEHDLDFIQLHGDEDLSIIRQIKSSGLGVIKVVRVADVIDFSELKEMESEVDYFLFDTQTKHYGGSGRSFDWGLLQSYPLETPYLLSGGLTPDLISELNRTKLPGLAGIDVNSGFEIKPGLKDIEKLKSIRI